LRRDATDPDERSQGTLGIPGEPGTTDTRHDPSCRCIKRGYIGRAIDPVTLNLMKAIKQQFDPKEILNPGKVFPLT